MEPSETPLESIAEAVPPQHRDRFRKLAKRLAQAPEEDEDRQLVESVGLVVLTLRDVPQQVSELLEDARQALTEEQVTRLGDQFTEILKASLELPAYEDISEMTRTIQESCQRQQRENRTLIQRLSTTGQEVAKYSRILPVLSSSVLASLTTLVIGAIVAWFLVPWLVSQQRFSVPKPLWPYVQLQREYRLDHHDKELKGEMSRALRIRDTIGSYQDGKDSVVVIRVVNED